MNDLVLNPPEELVEKWVDDWANVDHPNPEWYPRYIASRAAQWGADQELEACCAWLADVGDLENQLRRERRPPQLSLKEQALEALEEVDGYAVDQLSAYVIHGDLKKHVETIRRALEALPEE